MRTFAIAALVLMLSACAGSSPRMQEVTTAGYAPAPEPGKALVVFMRPSGFGFAVQSTVYEIVDEELRIIGIISAKTKLAYQVQPGKRLFMAMGESADFMTAELQAGRTYYASVAPRMGMWKARFAFEPVRGKDFDTEAFKNDLSGTRWVEKSVATDEWFMLNRTDVLAKRASYYPDWLKQPEGERAALRADDGR